MARLRDGFVDRPLHAAFSRNVLFQVSSLKSDKLARRSGIPVFGTVARQRAGLAPVISAGESVVSGRRGRR